MILYLTKQTIDRYKVEMPEEMASPHKEISAALVQKEQEDRLLEWGGKLFYFDRKKCIQFVNFASKFTLFLVDVKKDILPQASNIIANYLLELYIDDKEMTDALHTMLKDHPLSCFGKLKDKSTISTLNYTPRAFLEDGYRLYDYIDPEGVLHTMDINYDVNFKWLCSFTVDGKKDYEYSGERFRQMMLERYGGRSSKPVLRLVK